jgi:hypothetical protein
MSALDIRVCQGPHCQQAAPHTDQERHRQMNPFLSRLDEAQRRWYVALESNRIGRGGDRLLAQLTGMTEKTIRRGRAELAGTLRDLPGGRVRRPGGGRPPVETRIRRS